MNQTIQTLEFYKIREMLAEYAISEPARQKLQKLAPLLNQSEVNSKIRETTEGRKILDSMGLPPLAVMKDMDKLLDQAQKGALLLPEQLTGISHFLIACSRLKAYLKKAEVLETDVAFYGAAFLELSGLQKEITQCIRNNTVEDSASRDLRDIRRKLESIKAEIKTKLDSLLRSKKEWFNDSYVSVRNGHFVLPVKKEYKNQVKGSVLDISSTGTTYFMEPDSVLKLEEEAALLSIGEENEIRRILYSLTALVAENAPAITANMDLMESLDFIFAKAKLSSHMKGIPPVINTNRSIRIDKGRHPLLDTSECVPLDFSIGNGTNGVIITGPNTGGKTVALKTVGLLCLMAQSGLHVPCEEADLCMNNTVLCDIGDGQSITENLSTFSSHISNIIHILNHSDRDSLILLDELGSGTDPAEGMGIAVAILEELRIKGCLFLATTHYPEIKEYAARTESLINAKMAFDRETLKPLYRLEIGEAGESCALYIAKRLGLPQRMLNRAYREAYLKEEKAPVHREEGLQRSSNDFSGTLEDILPVSAPSSAIASAILDNHGHIPTGLSISSDSSISPAAMTPPSVLPAILPEQKKGPAGSRSARFQTGDSVVVYPQKKIGIVFEPANEKGEVGVQIQKQKLYVSHKRLKLKVSAGELYPEDYDLSVVLDTVSNRKARKKMDKGHRPDLEIVYDRIKK